jgi:Tfp pilus assembly protein PilO
VNVASHADQHHRWVVDRQQLLILLLGAVMMGSFFLFVLWPKHCELSALGEAVEQERGLVTQKVATSQEGLYVSARIPGLRKAKDLCERRLPVEPRVPEFLQMVGECMAAEPTVIYEIQQVEGPVAPVPAPAVPLALRLTGPAEAVYRCFARIEGLERLNRVRHARIGLGPAAGQVVAEAEILAYYLPAEEAKAGTKKPSQAAPHKAEGVKG